MSEQIKNVEPQTNNVEPQQPNNEQIPENKEGGNISPPPQQPDIKADIMKEVGDYLLKFENKILKSLTQTKETPKEETTKKINF